MENVLKEVEALIYDAKVVVCRAENYRNDIDRGINANIVQEDEDYDKSKLIDRLMDYLIDAKHDFDRLRDEVLGLHENLEKLHRQIEWEDLSGKLYK